MTVPATQRVCGDFAVRALPSLDLVIALQHRLRGQLLELLELLEMLGGNSTSCSSAFVIAVLSYVLPANIIEIAEKKLQNIKID